MLFQSKPSTGSVAANSHSNPSALGASAISLDNQVPLGQNNALSSKINYWFVLNPPSKLAFATTDGYI